MFDVTPDEIASLNDKDLRTLVALLCEAEVALRGFSRSTVTWGGSQTAPDGGLDVRVSLPAGSSIEGFVPRSSTGIQVKKENMRRSKIISEMRPSGTIRDVIKNLAEGGGAYVIVSSGTDAADIELHNRHYAMREALADVANADQLHTDFYDRTRLASWVRSHPGLIAWVKEKVGRAVSGWQPFRNWSGGPDCEYILDERLRLHFSKREDAALSPEEGINKLRGMLTEPKSVVRLVGLSGVGKTRLIQALFDERIGSNPLPPAIAVYTNMSDHPDPQPIGLATNLRDNRAHSVLIVDNCPPDLHRRLADLCLSADSSVSVLTVEYDIREDQPEGTEVVRLDTSSEDLIEKLVRLRFPNVSHVDARTIAEVSGGNARIAIALAGTIQGTETISGLSDEELFQRLFRQRHDPNDALLYAAQACSLLYSFNGEDLNGPEAELPILGSLVEQSPMQLYGHVSDLLERDLVQRRSKWRAVLPHAIANRLAVRALERIPHRLIEEKFVSQGSDRLARSFSRRLSFLHESPSARAIVRSWLSPDGLLGNVPELNELGEAMLENIAPVEPEAALSALERVARMQDKDQSIAVLSRHLRLINSIAYDGALFERCAGLLVQVATGSSKDGNQKEAADLFASFFQLYLSGTHASVERRLSILEPLLKSRHQSALELGLKGLEAFLRTTNFSSGKEFDFGARSRDYGYHPRTREEISHWFLSALSLLERIADEEDYLSERLRKLLAQDFYHLWGTGLIFDELESLCRKFAERAFWPEGWIACRKTLHFDREQMPQTVFERLSSLEQALKPRNLPEQVRALVLSDRQGNLDLEDIELGEAENERDINTALERADRMALELGSAVAIDDEALRELLPELALGGYRIWPFARGLARSCTDLRTTWEMLVEQLRQASEEQRDVQALRGFLAEAWERDRETASDLLDISIQDTVIIPFFPLIQTAVPIDEHGISRLKQSLEIDAVHTRTYRTIVQTRASEHMSGSDLKFILERITAKPDGFELAIDILGMLFFLNERSKREHDPALVEAGRAIVQHLAFDHPSHKYENRLCEIIRVCLSPPEGSSVAVAAVLRFKDAVSQRRAYAFQHDDIFEAIVAVQPIAILDALFPLEGTDHSESTDLFERRGEGRKQALDKVPPTLLISWCEQAPDVRFPLAASLVTFGRHHDNSGQLEWTPVARALLAKAPDQRAVLKTFIEHFYPMSWSGSLASVVERNMKLLDTLEGDASTSVADLIREEKTRLSDFVERRRRDENERERTDNESFE
jgi:hypothetical protein